MQISNQAITVSSGYAEKHCEMHVSSNDSNQITIYGCMPQIDKPKSEKLAIPNPILYAEKLIKDFLKTNNIHLQGDVKIGITPKDAKQLQIEPSADLLQGDVKIGITPKDAKQLQIEPSADLFAMIKYMLQESDNVYASAITKQLGYAITREGSSKQGIFAIKQILKNHTNLNEEELKISDGVGTRYNLVTTKQLVDLLSSVYVDQKIGKIFWNSLPVSGKSGTLINRMHDTSLAGKVFAKTGSMHDVSSLSGYLINQRGKVIIFSIITNNINTNTGLNKSKIFEEKVLNYVYKNT